MQSKLTAHDAVTVVREVLQELLMGVLTPERTPSPVDAYLTEEDLFRHRNPQVRPSASPCPLMCALRQGSPTRRPHSGR